MIVKLCADNPKLALRLVQPGCSGKQLLYQGITIELRKSRCGTGEKYRYVSDGCAIRTIIIPPPPPICYPAFELDDDGRVVFYFDDKLFNQPSGRYWATILINNKCSGIEFDIDLCCDKLIIDQYAQTDAPYGDEEC